MGTNTLSSGVDGNVIPATIVNQYKEALETNVVPRNSGGAATDIGGDLGTSSLRWKNAYLQQIILGLAASGLSIDESSGDMQFNVSSAQEMKLATNLLTLFDNLTIAQSGSLLGIANSHASGNFLLSLGAFSSIAADQNNITFYSAGGVVGQFTVNGLAGSYLTAATVGTTELEDLGVTTGKLANSAVTADKISAFNVGADELAIRNIQVTASSGAFITSSTIDTPILAGPGGAALTVTFTGSAVGKTTKISCRATTGATASYIDGGAADATMSCFRDVSTAVGRILVGASFHAPGGFVFYDSSSSSARTYTFNIKTSGGNLAVTNVFFMVEEI